MKKLALFLALCLLVSSIGLAAFAEDPVVPGDNEITNEQIDGASVGKEEEEEPVIGEEEKKEEEPTPVTKEEEEEKEEEPAPVAEEVEEKKEEEEEPASAPAASESDPAAEPAEEIKPQPETEPAAEPEAEPATEPVEEDKPQPETEPEAEPEVQNEAEPEAVPEEQDKDDNTLTAAPGDFVVQGGTIIDYKGTETSITLPLTDVNGNPITRLSEACFAKDVHKIQHVEIPNGIVLDDGCFRDCVSLLSAGVHNNIGVIPAECFKGCTSLQAVTWSQNLTTIGQSAFENCTSLAGIPFNLALQVIGDNAFRGCSALTYVDLPASTSLTTIGQGAFSNCTNLREVIMPDSVTQVGNRAYENCPAMTKLHISTGVTIINHYTFNGCSSLAEINIPAGVTEIGREAFNGCTGVQIIRIPEDVRNVGYNTPSACTLVGDNAFNGRPSTSWLRWDTCTVNVYLGTNALGTVGFILAPMLSPTTSAAHAYCVTHTGCKFCSTLVRDFVERAYNLILGRLSDEAGLLSWCKCVVTGEIGAGRLIQQFMNSEEFKKANPTYSQIIEILYNVMLNRASDPQGKQEWLDWMNVGLTKDRMIWGFNGSQEFINLCNVYGMINGTVPLPLYRDRNPGATAFVSRCYTEALGRAWDPDGLEAWTSLLVTNKATAAKVAQGFMFSPEYLNKKTSNQQYVHDLYRTYFGRDEDPAGMQSWLLALAKGATRLQVLNGFAGSAEFEALAKAYGLKAR